MRVAVEAGQIDHKLTEGRGLISEELWSESDGGKYDYDERHGYIERK